MKFLEELAVEIRRRRKQMGINQMKAANLIGVDYRHYQNIEGGKINMRFMTVEVVCQFYGMKIKLITEENLCASHLESPPLSQSTAQSSASGSLPTGS